jgi:hypothetical protein
VADDSTTPGASTPKRDWRKWRSDRPRQIRINDADWADYELVCKAEGTDRSSDIRTHIERRIKAYRRRNPDAVLPSDQAADESAHDLELKVAGLSAEQIEILLGQLDDTPTYIRHAPETVNDPHVAASEDYDHTAQQLLVDCLSALEHDKWPPLAHELLDD